ncbi:MAG: hypothetical protein ACOX5T_07185 [Candidatus Cryptobacteroides sp.]|jgi:hypothetical protein
MAVSSMGTFLPEMKRLFLFFTVVLTFSFACCQKESPSPSIENSMYVVATDYMVPDGKSDLSDKIQALIDNNPNRTIFFPDGTYLLSKPISTPADPKKSVHLVLANYAVFQAMLTWRIDSGALVRLGGKYPYNSITLNGSNYGIEGGIIDGAGVADGISIDSGRETRITRVSIKHTKIGIHIKHGANNGSSDSDIVDVNIVGNDQKNSIGVLIEGYDNTLTNMRIASVNVGIWCKSGGNSLKNIHPLFIFNENQDYSSSVGFLVESRNNFFNYCYSDQFAIGFKINGPHCINLTDCFCWWYKGDVVSQTAILCDGPFNSIVSGLHVGFSSECPSIYMLKSQTGGNGVLRDINSTRADYSTGDVSDYYIVK